VRLEPPYIASLIVCVLLAWVSTRLPHFGGEPLRVNGRTALLHVTYLAGIFHDAWWNPVYWTLAIELQFYILIGLLFARLRCSLLLTVAVALACSALIPNDLYVTYWLPAFGAGIVTYQADVCHAGRSRYLVALALLTAGMMLLYGALVATVICCTALTIAYVRITWRPLLYLGGISYSLYLLHVPIGGRVINLAVRANAHGVTAVAFVIGATAASLIAAHVFSRLIEVPSRAYAHRLGRNPEVMTSAPQPPLTS
jgi:peptidoglycan/LPS O-acetylase OafA/YrhL